MEKGKEAKRKTFDELQLSDDFMFGIIMRKPEYCKPLLEMIMDIKIDRIEYPDKQKSMDVLYDAKSVRLDIYTVGDGVIYDVEIQTTRVKRLGKRSRYYQGMIDIDYLQKGEAYDRLLSSVVIFICMEDPFDKGLSCYTFENICIDDNTLRLNDATKKIFLNATGIRSGVTKELSNFLDYIAGKEAQDEYTRKLAEEVNVVKSDKEWRLKYMTFDMKLKEERILGREEGIKEGIREGIKTGRIEAQIVSVDNIMKKLSLSLEEACEAVGIQVEEYEEAKRGQ